MKRRLPESVYNLMTMSGAGIAVVSFSLIIFLFIIDLTAESSNPYLGIFTFILFPTFLILGLTLIAWGIVRERRRIRIGRGSLGHLPVVNLNDARHRFAFSIFFFGTILFLALSAFGSFKAYEYSDSVEFCGLVCHNVMHPEYIAYQHSPHARVPCADCHIGSGAEWFVKAKISGAYQVYSVLFEKYSKPIPTPVHDLRPAQETCEQCHWPRHFFSEKQRTFNYYVSDEKNTKWSLNLLMKIGGGNELQGNTDGIHWHMNIANEIRYAALDSARMIIPWVKIKHADGKEEIYHSTDVPFSGDQLNRSEIRRMDCIDCHNRPSHKYNHPAGVVNQYLTLGWIDKSLPYAKNITIAALERPYTSTTAANDSIAVIVSNFYHDQYPQVYAERRAAVDKLIDEARKIYSRNYFPEMRVSWRHYPDQIGHMYAPGCFRCHDGKHVNEQGKAISRDCNVCHTLLAQQFEDEVHEISLAGLEYRHPVNVDKAWKEMNCYDCHNEKIR
jgi:nitrate/TMAO reductase-like tetraheme cytochrome c subunit